MKTFTKIVTLFYLVYLPIMLVLMAYILIGLYQGINPIHMDNTSGTRFLLMYLMFMDVVALVAIYSIFEEKTWIISTYITHESIHTEKSKFVIFLKIKYHLRGYKVFYIFSIKQMVWIKKNLGINVFHLSRCRRTVHFEEKIQGSDQITYYSPWISG